MSDFLGRTLGGTLTCREGKLKVGDNSARAEQEINSKSTTGSCQHCVNNSNCTWAAG